MDRAYLGESFVPTFKMVDVRDPERTVDSAEYEIRVGGDIVATGQMEVQGNEGTFRFFAEHEGVNEIVVSYRMGQDAWKAKFRISVERP